MPFLTTGGHRLDYRWIPPLRPGLPVLVLLHEALGSVELWKDFPDRLAEATGCGVLAHSRLGHGRSDPPDGPRGTDYLHREALDRLPAVLRKLGVERPVLIGHSDGASIALILAGAGTVPVGALVLMAPHVFVEDTTIAGIGAACAAWRETDMERKLARYHDDAERVFRDWSGIWLDPVFRDWNIEACLPAIRCPVLLIQGLDDEYATLAQIDAIGGRVSGPVERFDLPGCGHSPHRDRPEATLAAISRFVDRHCHGREAAS